MVEYNQQFNGVIGKVGIFPIKESVKNQTVSKPGEHYGKQFNIEKTHTVAIKPVNLMIDGKAYDKWITLGHRKFFEGRDLVWQVEKSKDLWVDVWEGSEMFFWFGVNDNGYPSIDMKSIKLMKEAPRPAKVYTFGLATPEGGGGNTGGGTQESYNPVGALQGNAFNGAMILLKDKFDSPKLVETAMALKVINEEVKVAVPNAAGASIGMAILAACRAGKKIEVVKDIAISILTTKIPAIEAAWGGVATPPTPDTKQSAPTEPDASGIPDDDIPF